MEAEGKMAVREPRRLGKFVPEAYPLETADFGHDLIYGFRRQGVVGEEGFMD